MRTTCLPTHTHTYTYPNTHKVKHTHTQASHTQAHPKTLTHTHTHTNHRGRGSASTLKKTIEQGKKQSTTTIPTQKPFETGSTERIQQQDWVKLD